MTSTTDSKTLVEVKNLNLVYRAMTYRSSTWRDAFVDWTKRGFTFKGRDRVHVLKDINLTIKKGERLGVLGINGAGKTSLCRCIAGLYRPTTGFISLKGEARAIFDTRVGIQEELTGLENLRLLAQFVFPGDRKQQAALVKDAAEFSELGEFLYAPFRIYSTGMQTRLALSLMTARPSDILILDEVFDGADQFFREKITKRVMGMIEASGAVVFVSHSSAQIEMVCNRAIVLCDGVLSFDGPVKEALAFYEHTGFTRAQTSL